MKLNLIKEKLQRERMGDPINPQRKCKRHGQETLQSKPSISMPPTTPVIPEPSAMTVDEATISPKIDDSEMVILESDDPNTLVTESQLITATPGTENTSNTSMSALASETGDSLADTLWNWFEKLIDVKWSRDSVEHDEALEEISRVKQMNQDLLACIRADKVKIVSLKEQ